MRLDTPVTQQRLKELLTYDPVSGDFIWNASRGCAKAGSVAGCVDHEGYLLIRVDDRLYKAHRLAWLYMTGAWPLKEIDHRSRIPNDNRWQNLRQSTPSQNHQNRSRVPTGVTYDKTRRRWRARITANKKHQWIGQFLSREDAEAAYLRVKKELHEYFIPR